MFTHSEFSFLSDKINKSYFFSSFSSFTKQLKSSHLLLVTLYTILSNSFPFCKSHLIRIRNIIGIEKLKRVRWFSSLEKDEFLNLVSISDVCLDQFPFGGFNTSYDAFDYNIPVITMGNCEFLHGQFTSGLYRKMGLNECIVNTPEEYAQQASSIGINEKLRHKINRNIEMKKNLIFQEQASVDEWNELFTKLK